MHAISRWCEDDMMQVNKWVNTHGYFLSSWGNLFLCRLLYTGHWPEAHTGTEGFGRARYMDDDICGRASRRFGLLSASLAAKVVYLDKRLQSLTKRSSTHSRVSFSRLQALLSPAYIRVERIKKQFVQLLILRSVMLDVQVSAKTLMKQLGLSQIVVHRAFEILAFLSWLVNGGMIFPIC